MFVASFDARVIRKSNNFIELKTDFFTIVSVHTK